MKYKQGISAVSTAIWIMIRSRPSFVGWMLDRFLVSRVVSWVQRNCECEYDGISWGSGGVEINFYNVKEIDKLVPKIDRRMSKMHFLDYFISDDYETIFDNPNEM